MYKEKIENLQKQRKQVKNKPASSLDVLCMCSRPYVSYLVATGVIGRGYTEHIVWCGVRFEDRVCRITIEQSGTSWQGRSLRGSWRSLLPGNLYWRVRRRYAESMLWPNVVWRQSVEHPMKREPDLIFEFSCHEDNYELHNIMAESKMEANAESEPQWIVCAGRVHVRREWFWRMFWKRGLYRDCDEIDKWWACVHIAARISKSLFGFVRFAKKIFWVSRR